MNLKIVTADDPRTIADLAQIFVDLKLPSFHSASVTLRTVGGISINLDVKESVEEVVEEYHAKAPLDVLVVEVRGESNFRRVAEAMLDLADRSNKEVHLSLNAVELVIKPDSSLLALEEQFLDVLGIELFSVKPGDSPWVRNGAGHMIDFAFTAMAAAGLINRPVFFRFGDVVLRAEQGVTTPEALEQQYDRRMRGVS